MSCIKTFDIKEAFLLTVHYGQLMGWIWMINYLKYEYDRMYWHIQSGRIIMKHVFILVWKKDGADSKLYVTNLALTGLSTTAFVSLKNILKIHFIVMGTF